MKNSMAVVILIAVVVIAVPAMASAAEIQKGTIKGVDIKAGTITFCPEGKTTDMTLNADKSVDLGKVKPDMKAQILLDQGTVKDIKEMKKAKAPVGC